jgi:hypothetical protein
MIRCVVRRVDTPFEGVAFVFTVARPRQRVGNLPAETTSFVGRRERSLPRSGGGSPARLVSLVGPGGVGKTRLALRIAADLGRGFRDGAWRAELAEVPDEALVINAVVSALDLRDQATTKPRQNLVSYLEDKQPGRRAQRKVMAEAISSPLRSGRGSPWGTTDRDPPKGGRTALAQETAAGRRARRGRSATAG